MYVDIPLVKKCCCCVPLRFGLMILGYSKLATVLFGLFLCCHAAVMFMERSGVIPAGLVSVLVVMAIISCIHVLFVVSLHKKSAKLMRIFYYYFIVESTLGTVYLGFTVITDWFRLSHLLQEDGQYYLLYMLQCLSVVFLQLVMQLYIILSIRSELKKLESQSMKVTFVNNAMEAETGVGIAYSPDK